MGARAEANFAPDRTDLSGGTAIRAFAQVQDPRADNLLLGLGKGLFHIGQAGNPGQSKFGNFFHIAFVRHSYFCHTGGNEFCNKVLQQYIHPGVEFGFHERLVEQIVHRAADTCIYFFLQGLIGQRVGNDALGFADFSLHLEL